jgi:hypothetical protein
MPDPFVFVTTHTVNDGEVDSIKELSRTFTDLVEAADSGLIAFHFYISEDGTEVANIQVHANAASMDAYLPVAQKKISEALQLSNTTSIEVFGSPGPVLRQVLRHNEDQGVRVRLKPTHLDGFTRSTVA